MAPPDGTVPADRMVPHPDRLDPGAAGYARIMARHDRAVTAGEPGYPDPLSGLFVLTARYLWERGTCCSRGCRHCPWVERP